ncbi:MAG: 2-succinyl-5-enolpyruvyl-6-hydroxy-3-cyclohexene-1-carboxylic-acid synthase [Thermoleophilaceae bacterium]
MKMSSPTNRTYAPLQVLVDELARCGMTHAVTCPGSRNAPIVLALAAQQRVRSVSVIDERSAGFVALGLAKASGRPVAVTCTSGTAAANLLPAVAEAWESRVPLVVLTADRPPELRGVGAGQAIDQIKLYGGFAKWFCEVGGHEPSRETAVHFRALGCRAYATAAGGRPGPVHLNVALREPLAPVAEELDRADWEGRPGGRAWTLVREGAREPDARTLDRVASTLAGAPRGVIVAGAGLAPCAPAEAIARLAELAGWPVLAEPTSGLRCGRHDGSRVVAHYDALLRHDAFAEAQAPELVLRLGDMPTSKPLRAWLAGARQVVVDPHADWHEPTRSARTLLVADPLRTCTALAGALEARTGTVDPDWMASWRGADAAAAAAAAALDGESSEPGAYTALAPALRDGDTVWVASSMAIRDVETFLPRLDADVVVLANRGANGIDGTVSSALGAALARGGRTFLLTGELALLHDLGGVAAAARAGVPLTIVCVNNGGGGIFDFLPVAEHAAAASYEEHVATPSALELEQVAALAGLPHRVAGTPAEVREAAAEPALVEVRTDRTGNVELHRELHARIGAAIA